MTRTRARALLAGSLGIAVACASACALDVRLGGDGVDGGGQGARDATLDVPAETDAQDVDATAAEGSVADADADTDANAADADAGTDADASATDADADADANADADAAVVCVAPKADCNGLPGDGCEIDLSNDGDHCGRCDRSCLGTSCIAGVCAAATLGQGIPGPTWLTVDAQSVFVSTRGHGGDAGDPNEILRIDLPLAAPVTIAKGLGQFEGVALGASLVFYVRHSSLSIETDVRRNDRVGTPATFAAMAQNAVTEGLGIAIDGTDVYWAAGSSLYHATTATTGATGVAFAQPFTRPYGVATDATHVYVTDETAGTVTTVDRSTAATTKTTVGGTPRDVAVDGTHVYVAAGDRLVRVVKATGVVEGLETGLSNATGVAQDGAFVFFGSGGQIFKRSKFVAGRTPLAAGTFASVAHVAVDATSVYFTDPVGGKVLRVAK